MRKLLSLIICFLAISGISAQGDWQRMSPDTLAARNTAMMVDSLNLSSAQIAKVQEVNLEFAQKQKETRESFQGDRENMRSAMRTLRIQQNTALGKYLTSDQLVKWKSIQVQMRAERRQNGPPGRRGGGRKNKPADKT